MNKIKITLFLMMALSSQLLSAADYDKIFLNANSQFYTFTKLSYPFLSSQSGVGLSLFQDKLDVLEFSKKQDGSIMLKYHGKTRIVGAPNERNFYYTSRANEPLIAPYSTEGFQEISVGKKNYAYREMENIRLGDHEILLLSQDTEAIVFLDRKEIAKVESQGSAISSKIRWFRRNYLDSHLYEKIETIEIKLKQFLALGPDSFDDQKESDREKPNDLSFLGTFAVSEPSSRYGKPSFLSTLELNYNEPRHLSTSLIDNSYEKKLPPLSLFIDSKKVAEGDYGLLFTDEKDWMAASVDQGKIAIAGSRFAKKFLDLGAEGIIAKSTNLVTNLPFINGKKYTNKLNGFLLGNKDELQKLNDSMSHVDLNGSISKFSSLVPTSIKDGDIAEFIWYQPSKGADFEFLCFSNDPYNLSSPYLIYTLLFPDGSGVNFAPDHGIYVPSEDAYYFLIKASQWNPAPDQLVRLKINK